MRNKTNGRTLFIDMTPWMHQQSDGTVVAPVLVEAMRKPMEVADVEQEPESGDVSTDVTREFSVASQHFIPAHDSPRLSAQLHKNYRWAIRGSPQLPLIANELPLGHRRLISPTTISYPLVSCMSYASHVVIIQGKPVRCSADSIRGNDCSE